MYKILKVYKRIKNIDLNSWGKNCSVILKFRRISKYQWRLYYIILYINKPLGLLWHQSTTQSMNNKCNPILLLLIKNTKSNYIRVVIVTSYYIGMEWLKIVYIYTLSLMIAWYLDMISGNNFGNSYH